MNLFEKKRFDEYRNNDEIKKYLEKENLDLLDKNELKKRLKRDYTKQIIDFFYSELCKKTINYSYIKDVFENAFVKEIKEFEIIFLIDTKNYELQGFLISQLGECGIYSNAYVLNLICSKKSAPLLGAYLYMIKKFEGKPQIGILELAGSHTNVKALCAYNKFGFYPDTQLRDCFSDNMTMTVDLTNYSVDDIINTVVKGINIDKNNTKGIDLCNKFAIKDSMNLTDYNKKILLEIQNKIALLYNNLYFDKSEINKKKINSDINKLKKKFDKIKNKDSVKNSVINSVKDSVQDSKKNSVKDSVKDIVKDSVQDSKKNSVKNSVQDSKNSRKGTYKRIINLFRNYTRRKPQLL